MLASLTKVEEIGRPPRGGVDRNMLICCQLTAGAWSPPTRGRGSKRSCQRCVVPLFLSPPTRGRGSKPIDREAPDRAEPSPPTRGRGSKPLYGDGIEVRI